MLRKREYFLLKCRINRKISDIIFLRKINLQDISILCNNLSQMLGAGIALSEVFNIICTENKKKVIMESMNHIQNSVEKGETIYQSIKKFSNIYPLFMIEMIRVGEEGGKLETIFKYLSEYYEKRYKLLNKIKSAIAYPAMILITSIIVIIFLMTKIIPQFISTLSNTGGNIPVITATMLSFFTFLKQNFLIINLMICLVLLIIYKFMKTSRGKIFLDKLKLNIPVFSSIYNKFLFSQFTTSMSLLMSAGFPIITALEICSSVMQNKILEKRIYDSIESIKRGESIYNSFKKQNIGNSTFLNLIRIGEECGTLDCMLWKISNIFECEVEESLKKAVTFIEPVTILFLAAFIGIFVVAVLLPVFNIMDSIN